MSARPGRLKWRYLGAVLASELSIAEKLAAIAVTLYTNADGSNAYPSLDALAADTSTSRSTARRALRRLVAEEWIHVERPATQHRPTTYGLGPRGITMTPLEGSRGTTLTPLEHSQGYQMGSPRGVTLTPDQVGPSARPSRARLRERDGGAHTSEDRDERDASPYPAAGVGTCNRCGKIEPRWTSSRDQELGALCSRCLNDWTKIEDEDDSVDAQRRFLRGDDAAESAVIPF